MSTHNGPMEPKLVVDIQHAFLAGQFLTSLTYGTQLALFALCAPGLLRQSMNRKISSIFILLYATSILVLETIFCVFQERNAHLIFVDFRNYPEAPWSYLQLVQGNAGSMAIIIFLSDCILISRLWAISRKNTRRFMPWISLVALLAPIAALVFGVLWIRAMYNIGTSFYTSWPIYFSKLMYGISTFAVALPHTLFCIFELHRHRKELLLRGNHFAEHAKRNLSWPTILIHSGAPYTIFAILGWGLLFEQIPNQVLMVVGSFLYPLSLYPFIYHIARGENYDFEKLYRQSRSSLPQQASAGVRTTDPERPDVENFKLRIRSDTSSVTLHLDALDDKAAQYARAESAMHV